MIWGALIGAASTFLKDKVADWTEGTSLEKYTHQWDNPKWYDYLGSGIGGGIGGGGGQIVGEAIRGINQYQDDPDAYDYRRSVGSLLGAKGGAYGNIGSQLTNYLPDTRPQEEEPEVPYTDYTQATPYSGVPYGQVSVPASSYNTFYNT